MKVLKQQKLKSLIAMARTVEEVREEIRLEALDREKQVRERAGDNEASVEQIRREIERISQAEVAWQGFRKVRRAWQKWEIVAAAVLRLMPWCALTTCMRVPQNSGFRAYMPGAVAVKGAKTFCEMELESNCKWGRGSNKARYGRKGDTNHSRDRVGQHQSAPCSRHGRDRLCTKGHCRRKDHSKSPETARKANARTRRCFETLRQRLFKLSRDWWKSGSTKFTKPIRF